MCGLWSIAGAACADDADASGGGSTGAGSTSTQADSTSATTSEPSASSSGVAENDSSGGSGSAVDTSTGGVVADGTSTGGDSTGGDSSDGGATAGSSGGSTGDPTGGSTGDPTGGSTGGSAGGSTGDPGSGTTAGTGGEGPETCAFACEVDEDCYVDGSDVGVTCGADGLCAGGGTSGCERDDDCLVGQFEFGQACTPGGGECEKIASVCVDVFGEGHCAVEPSKFLACADLEQEELEVPGIDGEPVLVCGNSGLSCVDLGGGTACIDPCESDRQCEAIFNPAFAVCLENGLCGCATDDQCVRGGVGNTCLPEGVCVYACAGDDDCAGIDNPFDGAAATCPG